MIAHSIPTLPDRQSTVSESQRCVKLLTYSPYISYSLWIRVLWRHQSI